MKKLIELAQKSGIWLICSDVNEGKSMLLYNLLEEFKKKFKFELYTFGLRVDLGLGKKIYSIEELEKPKNSILIVDEFFSLFDLEDRKKRKSIEQTLRLIHHNNNLLILSGVPENMKKSISGKADVIIFKRCTIADFINGSRIKNICTSYKGMELGSSVLNLDKDEAIVFDGKHYSHTKLKYIKKYDSKLANKEILVRKQVRKSVPKIVSENVQKEDRKNIS